MYTISKAQIEQAIILAEKDGFPNQPLVNLLQSLIQQGEAQPVARVTLCNEGGSGEFTGTCWVNGWKPEPNIVTNLFTHPPAPKMVMLTASDLDAIDMHQFDAAGIQQAFCTKNGLTLEDSK